MKKKIMFDTNIYDRLPKDMYDVIDSARNIDYYITTIQAEELASIIDKTEDNEDYEVTIEKRTRNILMLITLNIKIVPILSLPGQARHGFAIYPSNEQIEIFKKIKNDSDNNIKDALIATAAISEGCILVTEDSKLHKRMQRYGYEVMDYSTYQDMIQDILEHGE